MGMRERQVLRASSCRSRCRSIVAGIRSAAVQVVATATLGAIFGSAGSAGTSSRASPSATTAMMFGGRRARRGAGPRVEGVFVVLQRLIRSPGLARIAEPRQPARRPDRGGLATSRIAAA